MPKTRVHPHLASPIQAMRYPQLRKPAWRVGLEHTRAHGYGTTTEGIPNGEKAPRMLHSAHIAARLVSVSTGTIWVTHSPSRGGTVPHDAERRMAARRANTATVS